MAKKKTHEEFVSEVFNLVGDEYTVLGTYEIARKKIEMRHNQCTHEWFVKPNDFTSGSRCPECAKSIIASKTSLTHEEFMNRVIEIRGDQYEYLSQYINNRIKIKMKHIICNHIWEASPKHLLNTTDKGKTSCPKCNKQINKNTEIYKKEVKEIVQDEYLVLGEYVNCKTKIKMKHNISICNNVFEMAPNCFLSGVRCPKCNGKFKRSNEEFNRIVSELGSGEYEVLSTYQRNKEKVTMRHNKCNSIFDVVPGKFIHRDQRCPSCTNKYKGENKIRSFLESNNIKFKQQFIFTDCINQDYLRFDFAVLDQSGNLAYLIEYDGQQHFKPVDFAGKGIEWATIQFEKTLERDRIKNQYCFDNQIDLYRIPYWLFDELENILEKINSKQSVEVDKTSFLVQ